MHLAGELLPLGRLASVRDTLVCDMRAVLPQMRLYLLLHIGVMEALLGDEIITEARDDERAEDLLRGGDPEPMSDDERNEVGAFWYSVACGEILVKAAPGAQC